MTWEDILNLVKHCKSKGWEYIEHVGLVKRLVRLEPDCNVELEVSIENLRAGQDRPILFFTDAGLLSEGTKIPLEEAFEIADWSVEEIQSWYTARSRLRK